MSVSFTAREHSVLRSNLAVRDFGVVAYAGVPFSPDTQNVLGSFCAIDSTPRTWTEQELRTLRDFAAIAEAYTAAHMDGTAGPIQEWAVSLLARGTAAAARLLRATQQRLDAQAQEILLEAVETQSEKLVELMPARNGNSR